MRIKRIPNFHVEVIYGESPEKADRIRQLWDLLISLPEPEKVFTSLTPPISQPKNYQTKVQSRDPNKPA